MMNLSLHYFSRVLLSLNMTEYIQSFLKRSIDNNSIHDICHEHRNYTELLNIIDIFRSPILGINGHVGSGKTYFTQSILPKLASINNQDIIIWNGNEFEWRKFCDCYHIPLYRNHFDANSVIEMNSYKDTIFVVDDFLGKIVDNSIYFGDIRKNNNRLLFLSQTPLSHIPFIRNLSITKDVIDKYKDLILIK